MMVRQSFFRRVVAASVCIPLLMAGCARKSAKVSQSSKQSAAASSSLFLTSSTESAASAAASKAGGASGTSAAASGNKPAVDSTALTISQANALKGKINLKGKTLTIMTTGKNDQLAKRFKDFCNGNVKFVTGTYAGLKSLLAAKIMSNQSPDIYFAGNQDYPSILYKKLLQPLNDRIDFNTSIWKGVKAREEQLKWTDGKYYLLANYEVGNVLWWNKKVFRDAGLSETPETLMAKDQWNWDTFYDLEKKTADVKNGVYGFGSASNLGYACLASGGEDIVKMTSQGAVNNVNSPVVAQAENFHQRIGDSRYCYQKDGTKLFMQGKMAMFYGVPRFADAYGAYSRLGAGDYGMVLFPKKPGTSGKYKEPGYLTGYGIPKGAKNLDCALAFLIMTRVDTAYTDQLNQEFVKEHHLEKTNYLSYYNQYYQQNFVPIVSLGVEKVNAVYWSAESKLRGGTPWATLAAQLSPQIDKALQALKYQ